MFKSRILGLISHYKTQDRDLLPIVKNEVVSVPMSDYQFMKYSEKRKAEIEQNKSKGKTRPKRRGGDGDNSDGGDSEIKSSYRAYS